MKFNRKKTIKIAIDSPAAAGAGTLAKAISRHYNLFYLDTGKIYRLIAYLKLNFPSKFNLTFLRKKIKKLKVKDLRNKSLISDRVGFEASIISKNNSIRKLVHSFQINCAYNPPKNYKGSILDGRDITSVIMKDTMFKFYITANLKVRSKRRFLELKKIDKNISFNSVLKSLKNRDYLDKNRKHSPLKKTKDSILINTSKLSKKACFYKIKAIMDKKLDC